LACVVAFVVCDVDISSPRLSCRPSPPHCGTAQAEFARRGLGPLNSPLSPPQVHLRAARSRASLRCTLAHHAPARSRRTLSPHARARSLRGRRWLLGEEVGQERWEGVVPSERAGEGPSAASARIARLWRRLHHGSRKAERACFNHDAQRVGLPENCASAASAAASAQRGYRKVFSQCPPWLTELTIPWC
jgi:hypothetical protein